MIDVYCESCNEAEATVHITRTVNGKTQKIHLCGRCAADGGHLNWPTSVDFPVGSLLGGLLEGGHGPGAGKTMRSAGEVRCSECGRTYQDFTESGFFGCAGCYEAFADVLKPLVRRIQGDTVHRGKRPKESAGRDERLLRKQLQEQLERAVAAEEYEKAAEIRDELKRLKEETE